MLLPVRSKVVVCTGLGFASAELAGPFLYFNELSELVERAKRNSIIDLVDARISDAGFSCVEVEWVGEQSILRVYIDGASGVDMDQCVQATRLLEDIEQIDDLIDGAYTLEVSSPGVERPLRTAEDFKQAKGKTVKVWLLESLGGQKAGAGEVTGCEGVDITVSTKRGDWTFPVSAVDHAHIKFDWS